MSSKSYEVYICKHNGTVVYIGEGKFGRHKHCLSGTSHVYDLNRLHFEKENVICEVVKVFSTKEESQDLENILIDKYQPIYNIKNKSNYVPIHYKGSEILQMKITLKNTLKRSLKPLKISKNKVEEILLSFE